MNAIYLKGEVEKALGAAWPAFAREHPNLAGILDRGVLIEEVTHALRSDAEFIAAVNNAQAAGRALSAVGGLIGEFVDRWLRRLL